MVEYQARFERLLAKISSLSQDKKVSCFVAGLKDSIRTNVQANQPTTLTMAIGLARLFEARDTTHRGPTTTLNVRSGMNVQGLNPTTSHVVKKMITEELSERRKKGLCFHYNDKYSPWHNCKKLFMIEANWEDEDDGDVAMETDEETQETSPRI